MESVLQGRCITAQGKAQRRPGLRDITSFYLIDKTRNNLIHLIFSVLSKNEVNEVNFFGDFGYQGYFVRKMR